MFEKGRSDSRSISRQEGGSQLIRSWTNKKKLLGRIIVFLIPALAVIIQSIVLLSSAAVNIEKAKELERSVHTSLAVGTVLHSLQLERGFSAIFVNSDQNSELTVELNNKYVTTDRALKSLRSTTDSAELATKAREMESEIYLYRNNLMTKKIDSEEVIGYYTTHNTRLLQWIGTQVQATHNGNTWQTLLSYYMVTLGKENMGQARARGVTALARGSVSNTVYVKFTVNWANGRTYLTKSTQFSPTSYDFIKREFDNSTLDRELSRQRDEISLNNGTGSAQKGQVWFANMTTYINHLKDVEDKLQTKILDIVDGERSDRLVTLILDSIILVVGVIFFPVVVVYVLSITKTVRYFANSLNFKSFDLTRERKKVENLLCEILPFTIAEKLMQNQTIKPEHYASATIYFSDIVGFTKISSKSTPSQVVAFLNNMYTTFDQRLECYDVYKVETIGDAYMIASGLPEKNGNAHSMEIALASIDLQITVEKLEIPHMPDAHLKMRIGLHTGPVVAGVVGMKMPRYCLFGDTVYIASKMESMGEPMKIQISTKTMEALTRDHDGFTVQKRGEIEIEVSCRAV